MEGGFDAEFIEAIPDDLTCIVCHLALKDPVQIAECGHRFCSICFVQIKTYAIERPIDFTCPTDRKLINEKLVFKDQAASRAVLSLHVKCSYHSKGCNWIGELRNFQDHVEKICSFKKEALSKEQLISLENQMKIFLVRMTECEKYMEDQTLVINSLQESVRQKDLKIKLLQDNIGRQLNKKDKEMNELKVRLKVLEEEKKINKNNSVQEETVVRSVKEEIKFKEKKIASIEKRISDIERLNPKMGVFEWHLIDYKHVSESSDYAESSIFYDYLYGHACRLSVRWFDRRKGRLGLYFVLCKEENKHLDAPFRMKVIIQVIGQDSLKHSHIINEYCYSEEGISDENVSLNDSSESNGDDYFLCRPDLDNYIVNDCMHFICYLI